MTKSQQKQGVKKIDSDRILRIAILLFAASAMLLSLLAGFLDNPNFFRAAEWLLILALIFSAFLSIGSHVEQEIDLKSGKNLAICLGLVMIGFAAYGNTITMHFMDGDEYIHLTDARYLIEHAGLTAYFDFFIRVANNDAEQLMRPLLNAPFVIGYLLFEAASPGYHVMNILMHAFSAIAIFLFVSLLCRRKCIGAFAGAMYVAHPLISRPVAWTATLTHTFPAFFFFATLLFFALYRRSKKSRGFLFGCSLLLLIDLMLWELAVLLPLFFLLLDFLFFKTETKGRFWRANTKEYLVWFGIVAFYALQILIRIRLFDIEVGREYLGYRFAGNERLPLFSFFGILLDGLFRPLHQSIFYGMRLQILSVFLMALYSGLFFWIGLGRRGDRRLVLFGLTLAVITYLPAINNAQFTLEFLMRARLFMLPAAGVSIAFAALLLTDERKRTISLVAAAVFVLLFTGLTASNNRAWIRDAKNQESMEIQLWKILSEAEQSRPLVFMPVSASFYNAERTQDVIETMFARWNYEHPGYRTDWRIIYSARFTKKESFDEESLRPLFIEVSNDNKTLTDISQKIVSRANNFKAQNLETVQMVTSHEKPPISWKWSSVGLELYEGSFIALEGSIHTITRDQLYLHVPPEGVLGN